MRLFPILTIALIASPAGMTATTIGDPAGTYSEARELVFDGQYQAALELFNDLVAAYPDNADYLLGQGQTLLWLDRPARAIPPLQKARELAPDYEDV